MPPKLVCLIPAAFFALPAVTFSAQVVLEPDQDATLYEDAEGDAANGSGSHLFFGRVGEDGGERVRRAVVRFDVSSIPQDAVIQAVQLQFQVNQIPQVSPAGGTASVHRVQSSWGEGASNAFGPEGQGTAAETDDATWRHRFYVTTEWTSEGGDFAASPSASVGYGTGLETVTFSSTLALRADVQSWVVDPAANHGWILIGNEDINFTARRVYARESTDQDVPLLTVDYVIPQVTDHLQLTEVASGLGGPVGIANAGDGSGRLFIVEQSGRIRILDTQTGVLLGQNYLDISALVDTGHNEQGLLGLAFHPDFSNNRQFYVYYTRDPGPGLDRSVVAMYRQSQADPNVADVAGTVLLEFEQDFGNHNGGDLHFGADGYLYIASGDGGGSGDPNERAQDPDTLLGKLLRIDVDATPPVDGELCGLNAAYGIPDGQAFPGSTDGCDEILHYGLRNPWRFSFDAQSEELFIGDVGQAAWEEIDRAPAGASGLNYGWPCLEGTHEFRDDVICESPVPPIIEYSSLDATGNCSVTGGYVYRGGATALFGRYIYGDYCSDRIWVAERDGGTWTSEEWMAAAQVLQSITAFGQDERCELYVADANAGSIYRIDDTERISRAGFEALRCQ